MTVGQVLQICAWVTELRAGLEQQARWWYSIT
jgi:hypothetical protein